MVSRFASERLLMTTARVRFCRLLVPVSLVVLFLAAPVRAVDDVAVEAAIDRGRDYLLKQLDARLVGDHRMGQLALETYALLVCGVSVDHPLIRKAFEHLEVGGYAQGNSYNTACTIFAYGAAIEQIENDFLLLASPKAREKFQLNRSSVGREYREQLAKGVQVLVDAQNDRGGWRYHSRPRDEDMSCIQFAVLGLGAGVKHQVKIPVGTWDRAFRYLIESQDAGGPVTEKRVTEGGVGDGDVEIEEPEVLGPGDGSGEGGDGESEDTGDADEEEDGEKKDGAGDGGKTAVPEEEEKDTLLPILAPEEQEVLQRGWSYTPDRGASWNMTCAGVSSMVLALEDHSGLTAEETSRGRASVRDGIGWLMERWTPTDSYYGMYSLEKVADLAGVRLFDTHDWYDDVATHLVGKQEAAGNWPKGSGHGENVRVATAFALLILRRATISLSSVVKDPGQQVIVYGRENGGQVELDRNWVYVRDLDCCIHLPTVLEILAQRPRTKLSKLVRKVMDEYPWEYSPELVPLLLEFLERAPSPKLAKMARNCLAEIHGKKADDDAYVAWYDAFEEARLLEEARRDNVETVEKMLEIYATYRESLPHKECAVRFFMRRNGLELVPMLLEDIEHRDLAHRTRAYIALTGIIVEPLPKFEPGGSKSTRKKQVAAIRRFAEKKMNP